MVGQMNCLITVIAYPATQNADGDIVLGEPTTWQKWARVKQNSGNLLISSGMTNFNEAFEIEMWYEVSRPTLPDYELDYKGKRMKIYNMRLDNEGMRAVETITAYTSN